MTPQNILGMYSIVSDENSPIWFRTETIQYLRITADRKQRMKPVRLHQRQSLAFQIQMQRMGMTRGCIIIIFKTLMHTLIFEPHMNVTRKRSFNSGTITAN